MVLSRELATVCVLSSIDARVSLCAVHRGEGNANLGPPADADSL